MAYKRWVGALAASTLMVGLVVGTGATQAFAASARAHTNMRASARAHVRDHAAVVLARSLRRSLAARGTVVLSMRAATDRRMHGYVVTWARGHVRGRLFVDSRTGHAVRMRAESAATTTTGVSLSAFLSALETTLATEAGAPVSAQSEDNGAITVFTLDVGGQTITVTVNTGAQATGTTGTTGTTTGTTTSTLQAPQVSMEAAVDAALGTASSLGTASLASPYAVAAEFSGWQQVYAGAGGQAGDQGLGLDLGSNLSDQIQGSLSQPAYVVVVNSAQGGQAAIVESSTYGLNANLPSLLGISLSGSSDGQAVTAAPAVNLNTAVTAAMATDSGGIPVQAALSTGDSGSATWQVELVNPDGSLSQITIDATTGAVVGQSSQAGSDQASQGSQGDQGDQGDQGSQGSQGGDG